MTPNDRDPWSWGYWPDWLGELGGLELGANPRIRFLVDSMGDMSPPWPLVRLNTRLCRTTPPGAKMLSSENAFNGLAMIPNTVNTHGIRPTGHKKR